MSTRRGRPPLAQELKMIKLTLRLLPRQLDALRRAAAFERLSVTDALRAAVRAWVLAHDPGADYQPREIDKRGEQT